MRVSFLASSPHFADHLRPIWDALPAKERGQFHTAGASFRVADGRLRQPRQYDLAADITVVASFADYKAACTQKLVGTAKGHVLRRMPPSRPVAMIEHGAGFSYNVTPSKRNTGGSYAGGLGREHVSIFPSTNRWVQEANLKRSPDVPAPLVGCPKLDVLTRLPRPQNDNPVIALSFHYNFEWCPETRWAFPHYAPGGLVALELAASRARWEILGHGHPRAQAMLRAVWRKHDWEFVPEFVDVCRRADVYVMDTSSTIYEFAALDRPVVVLDSPEYRTNVHHGIRFWDHADVGVRIVDPKRLPWAIEQALEDPPEQREKRAAAVAEIYPYLGESSQRTIDVLRQHLEELSGTLHHRR